MMAAVKRQPGLIFVLVLCVGVFAAGICVADVAAAEEVNELTDVTYSQYLAGYANARRPATEIIVPAEKFTAASAGVKILHDFQGEVLCLRTGEQGYVEWEVEVPEAGLYNIAIRYFPVAGRGTAIERELRINGRAPFSGARYLTFWRVWGDAESIVKDNQGNELRPMQKEFRFWQEKTLDDSMGNYEEPYKFYFRQGKNTIRLISRREPMVIDQIRLHQVTVAPDYRTVMKEYQARGYQPAEGVVIKLQERDATYRSDPTISPQFDRGDPTMEPYHPVLVRLNSIGGDSWDQPGEWLEWEFTVPQDGLYKIAIKAKQNLQRGTYTNRRVLIDGKLPFAELAAVRFPYSIDYQMYRLGPEGVEEPYLVYLTRGKHVLRMEAVLGGMVEIIRTIEDSLYKLNSTYRRIIMVTSPTPDPLRSYQLEKRIPGLTESLAEQARIIAEVAAQLEAYTGEKGDYTVLLLDLVRQLEDLAEEPDTIPSRLGEFRDNLGALGTWLLNVRRQPLEIDYLVIASPEQELPRAQPTLWERMQHEMRALVASYTHNYRLVGDIHGGTQQTKPLKVWIGTGRDQAQIMKRLIENDFTPKTGIPVNLELVDMGVLLPAALAGRGPDVAIGVPTAQPINFALRGGVVDLTTFPDFSEVAGRFMPSALVPFRFRDSVYALPDQQAFAMLFYRKDILDELGLSVPQTWEDVLNTIPELAKSNMEFGLPFSVPPKVVNLNIGAITANAGSLSSSGGVLTLITFLYQQGEELFVADGLRTNLDSEIAVQSFIRWTDLFELYKLPLQYDPANRFRMGEMPLVMASYTLYNMLQVFAPELRGKWGFTLIPGTRQPDGTIDRSVPSGAVGMALAGNALGTGTVIMSSSGNKQAAWEFLKWWTSTEVQVTFGRRLESLMGPAARYPTANVEALEQLPWSLEDYQKLKEQWEWVRGVPEVPGGYMIGRYLDNAFRRVVYHNEPARDTLLDYNRMINEEITRKRSEFGLATTMEALDEKWRKLYWLEDWR